jgi:uncharacterized cupredoxin-like copper-binding protein
MATRKDPMNRTLLSLVAVITLVAAAGAARAHGDAAHAASAPQADVAKSAKPAKPATYAFGRPGDAKKVTRTIHVTMDDSYRFTPSDVTVRRGQTVRFVISNIGQQMHEMVLGTTDELKAHAELMRRFPDMEHADANMAHVEPGEKGEIVWQFTRPGEYAFGCLIAGHYEAGMSGRLVVRR